MSLIIMTLNSDAISCVVTYLFYFCAIQVSSQGHLSLNIMNGLCQENKQEVACRRLPVFQSITSAYRSQLTIQQAGLSNDSRRETGVVKAVGFPHGHIKCDGREEYIIFRIGQFLGDINDLKVNGKTIRMFGGICNSI